MAGTGSIISRPIMNPDMAGTGSIISRPIMNPERYEKLPWIFILNESRFTVVKGREPHYYLYDLRQQKLYDVTIRRLLTKVHLFGLTWISIKCIKLGWLLAKISKRKRLHLFNLFTQKHISLPKAFKRFDGPPVSTFRYCPMSRTFVVYAAKKDVDGALIIKRWESGDRKWESYNFTAEFPTLMKEIANMELVDGVLYCIFETGVVGSFNERSKCWSVVVVPEELFCTVSLFHTFEFRGELLMMDFLRHSKSNLWRLNESEGRWEEVVHFHKCAIFFSKNSPYSVLCSEQLVQASDTVATRLYYFTDPSSVCTKDFNDAKRTSREFEIMNMKFPSSSFPIYWIEPCPSFN